MYKDTIDFIVNYFHNSKTDTILNDHFPQQIYSRKDLFGGFSLDNPLSYNNTLDGKIISYLQQYGQKDFLMQEIHDVFMGLYLRNFIKDKKIIGIMGQHLTSRKSSLFYDIALMCRDIALEGIYVINGGGPGIMEAASFGAYFANYSIEDFKDALSILQEAPLMTDNLYRTKAFEVILKYPTRQKQDTGSAISVPTWAFGAEPTSIFSEVFAKFFDDGKREYVLLEHSNKGIVYAPGGVGTLQEFFEGIVIHYAIKSKVPFVIYDIEYKDNIEKLLKPLIDTINKEKKLSLIFADQRNKVQEYLLT